MKPPIKFSYSFIEPIKRHKSFAGFMLIVIGVCIFCAVLAGMKFNNNSLLLSFSNVVVVKFLRGNTGFGGMLFNNIFAIAVFSVIIVVSCIKKYSISIGIFFYGYYVYAQMLTLIAFVLEYGLFNTLVVAMCMLITTVVLIFLLLELFLICLDCQCEFNYFKFAFKMCVPIFVCMIIILLIQNIVFFVLKNYIILLVY